MKPTQIASIVALSIASSAAFAEQTTQLDTLVLSGGFTPISEESYARSYTIISEEEIEQSQEKNIAHILRKVPGLHVSSYGGAGGETAIRVRGSESNHVLVLIDGIEAANSSNGFNFANLTTDHIERIEVLRGPQSALYGAGATAGIINIITKSVGQKSTISVELVNTGGYSLSGQFSDSSENANYSIGLTSRQESGWDAKGNTPKEDDGFQHNVVNYKGSLNLANGTNLSLISRYGDRKSDYDETIADNSGKTDGKDLYLSLSAEAEIFDGKALFKPVLTFSEMKNKNTDVTRVTTTDASTIKFAPQLAFDLGEDSNAQLVVAADIEKEKYQAVAPWFHGNKESRNSHGIAAEYTNQATEKLFVQTGLRHDSNDKYGNFTSWSASTSYSLNDSIELKASTGKGQTNPTFAEVTSSQTPLLPEQNSSWDIGINSKSNDGKLVFSGTYFNETLKDAIISDWAQVNGNWVSATSNSSSNTKKKGVEISATLILSNQLTLNAAYTHLDAKDSQGVQLVRRPENTRNINIAYISSDQRTNFDVNVEDVGVNSENNGYTVVDLSAAYNLSDKTKLYGSVKNAFDETYEEIRGYNSQPRTIYLGVKHSW